ncbi:alpha/beta fold hydrolase [Oculatella sp. LEGE 06141]|uniref:YheT family hydrolase n=1 Tax=Oculatella sp. LEGE 06141 TaxID=1828648 RepID=UPI0018821F37|nr:alpha/beta fold hydrolase [Oculatella sp. LEGE 06141]MBE9182645.1 alpha/beta fold hydrolase [Oculatella sp. LEGE 06141]
MNQVAYSPPWGLRNGLAMTLYTALQVSRRWETLAVNPEPLYQPHIFTGARDTPIFGKVACPPHPKGTIIGTYGITGSLENQWFLKLLGRKAVAQGYAVVLFDWRAHGKTAELSPALTSDGLYEGEDFVRIAAQAKAMGYPAPFWFTAYSLGAQLALWAVKAAQTSATWGADLGLNDTDIAGAAVICPSLDSNRSLTYLVNDPWGRYLERAIARQLQALAWQIHAYHPGALDPSAIARVNSIRTFDHELVIQRLGFESVEAYYDATSPLQQLPHLTRPTLILYAADDPMFDPTLVPELKAVCAQNAAIDLRLTSHGGHVGYLSSSACQRQLNDPDPWWSWNRVLEWFNQQPC